MELRQRVGLEARELMPNQKQDEALWEGQRGSGRLSRGGGGRQEEEEDTTERRSLDRIHQAMVHQAMAKTSVYPMYLMEQADPTDKIYIYISVLGKSRSLAILGLRRTWSY